MVQGAATKVLILIDGDCMLCSRIARFLKKADAKNAFLIQSYQKYRNQFSESKIPEPLFSPSTPESLIVIDKNQIFTESDATLRIILYLPGLWKMLLVFRLIPRVFRDLIYKQIAKRRNRWTGKKNVCDFTPFSA